MPPGQVKRSAEEALEDESGIAQDHERRSQAVQLNGSEGNPAKRARRSSVRQEQDVTGPVSDLDQPAQPFSEEDALPPPPTEDLPPAPPSPPEPSIDIDSLVPPPPPEEPSDARKAQVAQAQEQDDAAIGGAEYWAELARNEEIATEEDAAANGSKGRDLYLDSINRSVLDFDFEKLCSVSLSNVNVYACLVCGKYFQGRGTNSYAYFHSINDLHRVYMNMETGKVYVLPDNYMVNDSSLSDIKYLLHPTYSDVQIKRLDAPDARPSFDLRGNAYQPGFVGLNNLGANDYINVVIQALAHVRPLRNFLLRGGPPPIKQQQPQPSSTDVQGKMIGECEVLRNSTELVRRFASLVRKIWNARNTKAQVSPHEFLQEVASASKGRFSITKQGDPIEFMGWLLNKLHVDLGGGGKKNRRSIISDCFQGSVRVESQKVFVRSGIEVDEEMEGLEGQALEDLRDRLDSDGRKEGGQEDSLGRAMFNIDREVKVDRTSFFLLTVDLPPLPVFQDVIEKNIIPQVPIAQVLAKYDGITFQEARGLIRRFKTLKLPPFLILHYKRFTKNNFIEERNRTIVEYPVKGLSMADYVDDPSLTTVSSTYDLLASITLEATAGTVRENCSWRSQVHSYVDGRPIDKQADMQRIDERWFSIQDLIVESIDSQLLFLGESYIQIWARRAS